MPEPVKVCPQCQKPSALNSAACTHCGRAFRTTAPAMVPTQPIPSASGVRSDHAAMQHNIASALICPACAFHDTQKVSAIVQSGTVITETAGTTVGVGYMYGAGDFMAIGEMRSTSLGQSGLAMLLAPPARPLMPADTSNLTVNSLGIFAALTGLFSLLLFASKGENPSLPSLAVAAALLALALGLAAWWAWRNAQRDLKAGWESYHLQAAVWQSSMQNWERLCFCPRCGCVFDPQTRRYARAQEMHTLISAR